MKIKNILVTGAAGFIGYHLSKRLISEGFNVTGIDNMSPYYDVSLKEARIRTIITEPRFKFIEMDLADNQTMEVLFAHHEFDVVFNLAAQAGVRHSLTHPHDYIKSNVTGFMNVLEGCRYHGVKHLLFASSSSVYGANTKMPLSTHDNVDHPKAIYPATKKANEMMAHAYSSLYDLPCSGIRFFTVYGPYGRPDLSLFIFVKAILENKPIQVFNHGDMSRDFTYVDDVVESLTRLMRILPTPESDWETDPAISYAPYKIYNIGNSDPINLNRFIEIIEELLEKEAIKEYLGMQAGDVKATYADVDDLMNTIGYKPETTIRDGIKKFIEWYKEYYK